MSFDVNVAMTWVLFAALFPMAYFWLRRAWRILVRRDYSEVALKRGLSPPDPRRFAPYTAAVNLTAGGVVLSVATMTALALLDYGTWSAIAGMTIWFKIIADFIVSRHAHAAKPLTAAGDKAVSR